MSCQCCKNQYALNRIKSSVRKQIKPYEMSIEPLNQITSAHLVTFVTSLVTRLTIITPAALERLVGQQSMLHRRVTAMFYPKTLLKRVVPATVPFGRALVTTITSCSSIKLFSVLMMMSLSKLSCSSFVLVPLSHPTWWPMVDGETPYLQLRWQNKTLFHALLSELVSIIQLGSHLCRLHPLYLQPR